MYYISFIFFLLFIFLYFYERRTLLLSFSLILFGASLTIFLYEIISNYGDKLSFIVYYLLTVPLAIILILAVVSFTFGPIAFILLLLYNGAKILRKEGFNFKNLLSLGLGLLVLLYIFILPFLSKTFKEFDIYRLIYGYFTFIIIYFVFISFLYTLSSFLNQIHILPYRKIDYVVVLGAGLIGDKVTPLLASRIDKGIKIFNKYNVKKIIMSGGQGQDELVSEAFAMKNYALSKGISESSIMLEDNSTNTEENIKYSYELMEKNSNFAVVTNYYHLFRALLIAKSLKIKCIGYGANTKFYFSLNAFIREFIGYLYLDRKKHFLLILIFTIVYVIGSIISLSGILY